MMDDTQPKQRPFTKPYMQLEGALALGNEMAANFAIHEICAMVGRMFWVRFRQKLTDYAPGTTAEDLGQSAYAHLLGKIAAADVVLDPDRSPGAFVRRLANNWCLNFLRDAKRKHLRELRSADRARHEKAEAEPGRLRMPRGYKRRWTNLLENQILSAAGEAASVAGEAEKAFARGVVAGLQRWHYQLAGRFVPVEGEGFSYAMTVEKVN